MLGWRFAKFEPNYQVFIFKKGRIIRQGTGIALRYYTRSTSIIMIPCETKSVPFIFEETTSDYQTISVQGEIIYRISDPTKTREQVNYTVSSRTLEYLSDDPTKLEQRIVNAVKTLAKKEISGISLRDSVGSSDSFASNLSNLVRNNEYLAALGIGVTAINVLAILPNKDTARALEAQTREAILKEADDALYRRRNSAVEQERIIKENELNTDIAVEQKKRQIRETQMDAERSVKEKERTMLQEELQFKIKQEQENSNLVELSQKNQKTEADTRAYTVSSLLDPLSKLAPEVIRALSSVGMNPEQLIASAFSGLANNAEKIGQLNISPELLQQLLKTKT